MEPDPGLAAIADYVLSFEITNPLAYEAATYCLMDSLACGFHALKFPACTRLLGPVVPGATLTGGARVPGTSYELDPINAAFNIGAMIRWPDADDPGLAADWLHPSDSLAGILAVADYLSRNGRPVKVRDMLTAMIKAHELQCVLALDKRSNGAGSDPVILRCVASTAVLAAMLGATRGQIINAVSNAWIDDGALPSHRDAPDTGSRRAWAAGEAASRAVRHALFALKDEMGHPAALSADPRGVEDAPFARRFMENVICRLPTAVPVREFETRVAAHFGPKQTALIKQVFADNAALGAMPVSDFVAKLVSAC